MLSRWALSSSHPVSIIVLVRIEAGVRVFVVLRERSTVYIAYGAIEFALHYIFTLCYNMVE